MKTLLAIHASGRVTRSITRRLAGRFIEHWQAANPAGRVIQRDIGRQAPAPVNEPWIAAAFADPGRRTPAMQRSLASSEQLIADIESADAMVLGTPMYNFGVPAQLKAYFDQIIRVNRTFAFDPDSAEPYRPLLSDKPVTVIVSVGDGSLLPGHDMAHLNFLEPHLSTMLGFIGLTKLQYVRVGYEEFQDHRLHESLAAAERAVTQLARSPIAA